MDSNISLVYNICCLENFNYPLNSNFVRIVVLTSSKVYEMLQFSDKFLEKFIQSTV